MDWTGKINGERVEERRKAVGLTQEELAAAIGLKTQGSIHVLIKGIKQLSIQSFSKLITALETSGDYLLGLTDNPAPCADGADRVTARITNEQSRRICQSVLDRVKVLPQTDQLFILSLVEKIGTPQQSRTAEATEAATVIDNLTPADRAVALADVYQVAANAHGRIHDMDKQIAYLMRLVTDQTGVDAAQLIREKFPNVAGC